MSPSEGIPTLSRARGSGTERGLGLWEDMALAPAHLCWRLFWKVRGPRCVLQGQGLGRGACTCRGGGRLWAAQGAQTIDVYFLPVPGVGSLIAGGPSWGLPLGCNCCLLSVVSHWLVIMSVSQSSVFVKDTSRHWIRTHPRGPILP